MTKEKNEHSIFERRWALQAFKKAATQETIEEIADDLFIRQKDFIPALAEFVRLSIIFTDSTAYDDNLSGYMLGRAIRYRDSDYFKLLADEFYEPGSQRHNPEFVRKTKAILDNEAPPALRAVK